MTLQSQPFKVNDYCSLILVQNTQNYLHTRNFYPKRVDFYDITQNELDAVVNIINNRFCKCFEYKIPVEVFAVA